MILIDYYRKGGFLGREECPQRLEGNDRISKRRNNEDGEKSGRSPRIIGVFEETD